MIPVRIASFTFAASSLALVCCVALACGEGKPPRKDRHRDSEVSAAQPTQDAPAANPSDDPDTKHHKKDKADKEDKTDKQDKKDHQSDDAANSASSTAGSSTPSDAKDSKNDKRKHDHTVKPTDVQWLLTMHGVDGKPQGIWALTGEGHLQGPVNAPLADGPAGAAPHDLRGLTPLPDGGFLAMNAFMKDTRILHFGAKNDQGVYPFIADFVKQGPENPAMVHAYQMAIGPDGQVYVSNQDTNTVTRYVGLGQPNAGQPLSPPAALSHLADLAPGVIVPNAKSSPEGITEVRGIAFAPDGLLYVCDRTGARVSGYDTTTGRRIKIVADASHGLKHPIQLAFTPDGTTMFIGDNGVDGVFKVNLASGAVDPFIKKDEGGLKAPSAIVVQGNWLFVASREGKKILRFHLKDGKADDKPFAELPDNPEFLMHIGE